MVGFKIASHKDFCTPPSITVVLCTSQAVNPHRSGIFLNFTSALISICTLQQGQAAGVRPGRWGGAVVAVRGQGRGQSLARSVSITWLSHGHPLIGPIVQQTGRERPLNSFMAYSHSCPYGWIRVKKRGKPIQGMHKTSSSLETQSHTSVEAHFHTKTWQP